MNGGLGMSAPSIHRVYRLSYIYNFSKGGVLGGIHVASLVPRGGPGTHCVRMRVILAEIT